MKKIYRTYEDTEVVQLATNVKCPYCGYEWLEIDMNECGEIYHLTCEIDDEGGCGKEFLMEFSSI